MTNHTANQSDFGVLVVEDEAIVARDLAGSLAAAGYRVVGPVATGKDAVALAAVEAPGLALVDIQIAGEIDGIETARQLWHTFMLPSLFVTAHTDEQLVARAARPGALGYIVKPFDEQQLHTLIRFARVRCETERPQWKAGWQQSTLLDAFVRIADEVDAARQRLRDTEPDAARVEPRALPLPIADLSKREREVLRLLMDSHRVPAIAEMLFISQHTVRNHLKAMFRKLGVSSQSELIDRVRRSAAQTF